MNKLICSKCGKRFKSVAARCGHEAHCGIKKEKCPVCLNEFNKFVLSTHLKTHEKDSNCKECGKLIYHFEGKYKFCSQSCSAKYNNKKRERKIKYCKNCNRDMKGKYSKQVYCSMKCQKEFEWNKRKEKYIKEDCIPTPKQRRRFLLERDGNKCEICGLEKWNNEDIPLVADHIDGNSDNNSISNLRLICNNCDALLPTYKNKNKGNGRANRRKRYKENKSY